MRTTVTTVLAILTIALAGAAAAQEPLENHPGFFALEELGLLDADAIMIDVNLSGSLIRLISGATEEGDPEFSGLMAGLKRIRVLVGRPSLTDSASLLAEIENAARRLEADGWQSVVKIRDGNENVRLLVKDSGEKIEGLTVLIADGMDEVVLVNIVGKMDPGAIGRLGGVLGGISGLEDLDIDLD